MVGEDPPLGQSFVSILVTCTPSDQKNTWHTPGTQQILEWIHEWPRTYIRPQITLKYTEWRKGTFRFCTLFFCYNQSQHKIMFEILTIWITGFQIKLPKEVLWRSQKWDILYSPKQRIKLPHDKDVHWFCWNTGFPVVFHLTKRILLLNQPVDL